LFGLRGTHVIICPFSHGAVQQLPLKAERTRSASGSEDRSQAGCYPITHASMEYGLSNGPDSDEIAVLHGPYVVDVQRDKRLSFTGCGHELHLQASGLVHLHNGPKVSVAKTMLG
jgi:hypothetical protein